MAKNEKKQKNMKLRICIWLLICVVCAISFIWQQPLSTALNNLINPPISSDVQSCELKVHYISVGQGDSILLELPDDKIMLIDAGPGSGEDTLIKYLNSVFVTRPDRVIDYFLVTHQDEDHIGGADKVFDNFEVEKFYRPKVYTPEEAADLGVKDKDNICDTKVFETMIEKMAKENCKNVVEVEGGKQMPYLADNCGYNIKFLSPIDESYADPNDYSPIMILTYEQRKFMFTGDAEEFVEDQVVARYSKSDLDIDVLKVGHHGSNTSSSEEFLDAVDPQYAVICVGKDNKYNHPTESTISKLTAKVGENNIYRTDNDGNVIIGIDKDETTMGKASIKIATNGEVRLVVKIEWWYVVVIVVGVSFVVLILPAKSQKKLAKKLKNK